MTSLNEAVERLRAKLEEYRFMAATSEASNVRFQLIVNYADLAALIAFYDAVKWQPVTKAQMDGKPIAGLVTMRYAHYTKKHRMRHPGQVGRWQEAKDSDYGGWVNMSSPPKYFLPHPDALPLPEGE